MLQLNGWLIKRRAGAILCGVLLLRATSLMAQTDQLDQAVPQPQPAPAELLAPDQLDNLVAPVALYPDELLAQVLAASTYPLEIVEAQQWLQQNRGLQGQRLLDAARQQNWDASVQALIAFPDAMRLLTSDIRWTTDLGNAFLAQQADVMNAVQRMRARAQQNGRLASNPQQAVTVDNQDGQSAIEIQPTNPQIVYVPTYDPAYVWGPPVYGAYPPLGYGPGYGFLYGAGVFLGGLFSGLFSFGGWGWGFNWLAHGLFLNNLFLGHFGFGGFHGGFGYGGGIGRGFEARSAWVHDPGHRLGVPYANRAVASRFGGARSGGFANARSFNERSSNGRSSVARSFNGGSFDGRSSRESSNAARSYGGGIYGGARSYDRGGESFNRGGEAFNRGGEALNNRGGEAFNRSGESFNRGGQAYTNRGSQPTGRSYSNSFSNQSGGQEYRGSSNFRSDAGSRNSATRASQPHYSAPRQSPQHFSNPSRGGSSHFSAPKGNSGGHSGGGHASGGGHSGGGHSGGKHK